MTKAVSISEIIKHGSTLRKGFQNPTSIHLLFWTAFKGDEGQKPWLKGRFFPEAPGSFQAINRAQWQLQFILKALVMEEDMGGESDPFLAHQNVGDGSRRVPSMNLYPYRKGHPRAPGGLSRGSSYRRVLKELTFG